MRTVGSQLGRVGRHLQLAWPVFVIFLAQRLITLGFVYHEAGGLGKLASRWDAGWYLRLAQDGYVYPNVTPDGEVRASNLAYFPLFPWLVRGVGDTGWLSLSQALVVVSWFGGLLAAWAIFAGGHALYGRPAGIALAAVWGMAPASLALTMGYPEGWFTAAAAAAFFFLIRRRPIWAGVAASMAGLLRPSAVAVIAMVGVYFLVELGRWSAARRSRRDEEAAPLADRVPTLITFPVANSPGAAAAEPDAAADIDDAGPDDAGEPDAAADPAEPDAGRPRPFRAFLGAVVATLGLGAFMVYVGMRTGEVFGYFTVQGQWGQRSAGFAEYGQGIVAGLFGSPSATLVPVTIAVSMGYLVLFCLIVFDRRLVYASVYAAGMLVLSLTHITFQHVYARQLLPAFVLLIPLIRMRVPRSGAIAALTVGSVLMSWGAAQFLLTLGTGI